MKFGGSHDQRPIGATRKCVGRLDSRRTQAGVATIRTDGACETCGFPFAHLSHPCLGSGEQIAS